MSCASLAASDVRRWKNSRVPDLAMVPMCSITSWRDMPMPLSETVIVPGARVVADADLQLRVVLEQRAVGDRFEAQLVAGVRRVRDQLAQEDLLVAVQGVDHQVEELLDLGLEAEGFFGSHGPVR